MSCYTSLGTEPLPCYWGCFPVWNQLHHFGAPTRGFYWDCSNMTSVHRYVHAYATLPISSLYDSGSCTIYLRLRTFVFIIIIIASSLQRSLSALHFKSIWSTEHSGPPCYWTIKRIEVKTMNKVNGRHYFRSIVKQVAQDLFGQMRW